jgi:hypothetical protein
MRALDQTARGLRLPQREGMKMVTLSANAQRIGDDIMRLVNARDHPAADVPKASRTRRP